MTLGPSDVVSLSHAERGFHFAVGTLPAHAGSSPQLGARQFAHVPKLTLASPRSDSTPAAKAAPSHNFLDPKLTVCMPDRAPQGHLGIPVPRPPPGSAAVEKFLIISGFILLCELPEDKQANGYQQERELSIISCFTSDPGLGEHHARSLEPRQLSGILSEAPKQQDWKRRPASESAGKGGLLALTEHRGSLTKPSSPDFRAQIKRKFCASIPALGETARPYLQEIYIKDMVFSTEIP